MRETRRARHCGAPEACVSEHRECSCHCAGCAKAREVRKALIRRAIREREAQ